MKPDNANPGMDDQRSDSEPPHSVTKGSTLTHIVEEWLFEDQGEDSGDLVAEWCCGDADAFSIHIAELD